MKNVELELAFLGNILINQSLPKDINLTENDFYDINLGIFLSTGKIERLKIKFKGVK